VSLKTGICLLKFKHRVEPALKSLGIWQRRRFKLIPNKYRLFNGRK
jgi:hypothetical protein